VVENNTVAYKKDAVWYVVTFLGLYQIWRGLGPRDFLAIPLPHAVARQTSVQAGSTRGHLSVPTAGP